MKNITDAQKKQKAQKIAKQEATTAAKIASLKSHVAPVKLISEPRISKITEAYKVAEAKKANLAKVTAAKQAL